MLIAPVSCFVSTHSRLKAAGTGAGIVRSDECVSTHSRLKAAGDGIRVVVVDVLVSTHSRLKAAGTENQT